MSITLPDISMSITFPLYYVHIAAVVALLLASGAMVWWWRTR